MKTFNVGALWIHEHKDEITGNNHVYMTGYIDLGLHGRVKVSLHSNPHKMEDKHPDYIISRYEPDTIEAELHRRADELPENPECPF